MSHPGLGKNELRSPFPEACVVVHTSSHHPGPIGWAFYADEVACKCKLGVGWRLGGSKTGGEESRSGGGEKMKRRRRREDRAGSQA